jgi:hypothetical protein
MLQSYSAHELAEPSYWQLSAGFSANSFLPFLGHHLKFASKSLLCPDLDHWF